MQPRLDAYTRYSNIRRRFLTEFHLSDSARKGIRFGLDAPGGFVSSLSIVTSNNRSNYSDVAYGLESGSWVMDAAQRSKIRPARQYKFPRARPGPARLGAVSVFIAEVVTA